MTRSLDSSRRRVCGIALAAALAIFPFAAQAQAWPSKPVRIVVGYPPGGAVDANARLLAPKLAEIFGQSVIVENRPGAAAQIATDHVAKSAPDGYTVLLTTMGHAIAPSLHRKLSYDPVADLASVSQTTAASMILVVNPKVAANTLKDFVAMANARPGGLNYGSAGMGDPLGFTMEVFKVTAGINVVGVQYKGVGPVYTALLAGEVDAAFMPTSLSLGHLAAGRLRALATGSPQRLGALPDVPTVAESGYAGFEATNWQGMFVPSKTPAEIVRTIQSAVARALAMPDVRERMLSAGQEPVGSTPEAFDAKLRAEMAKFARIVKEARIPLLD